MPLLFRLAIHDSLVEARQEMCKAHLFAHLDDVYAVCALDQNRTICNMLANKVETGAGISHTGKTRVKNRASTCPPDIQDLWDEVWNPEGIEILETPVGSHAFVEEIVIKRLEGERRFWDSIPWVPDLQCAWQILLQWRWATVSPHVAHTATRPVEGAR